jgi:hypothetical protein
MVPWRYGASIRARPWRRAGADVFDDELLVLGRRATFVKRSK